jgi:hypothetical protein
MNDRSRRASELIVVVRIPKSASLSLSAMALQAFPDRQVFVLPNTLDLDGRHSFFQRLRHARHVTRLTLKHHRTLSLARVYARINQAASAGALVTGGHIDFESCRKAFSHDFQMLTLIRNPVDRSLSEYDYARDGFAKKPFLAKLDASLIAKAAGRYSYEGYLDFLLERRSAFGDIACRYLGVPGADFARHFADHVFHFGLVDDMRSFAAGLARKTGHDFDVQHLNSSANVSNRLLSKAERRKVEDLYANDLALYEWCRRQDAKPGVQAAAGGT